MKNIFTGILMLIAIGAYSQSPSKNYVKNKTYRAPSKMGVGINDTIVNVSYYDGLGRELQTVNVRAGGNKQDIVTPFLYDEFGRQTKQYLPYANAGQTVPSLSYRDNNNLVGLIGTTYLQKFPDDLDAAGLNSYSETVYENSPLNRVLKEGAPGKNWKVNPTGDDDHNIKYAYGLNSGSEVRKFKVSFPTGVNTGETSLVPAGFYPANILYKKTTFDENWTPNSGKNNTVEEFSDKEGKLLLKRTYNNNVAHDTYYVYDRFSNLSYVLPPLASDAIIKRNTLYIAPELVVPWTKLFIKDMILVQRFDDETKNFSPLQTINYKLGGVSGTEGGLIVSKADDDQLTLKLNINTVTPEPLKIGQIADLSPMGIYSDREIGRIQGYGFNYVFSIRNNMLEVNGWGDISTIVTTFTSGELLGYSKNYPWTKLFVADSNVALRYESDIKNIPNADILTTTVPNSYGASGGFNISVDPFNAVTLTINMSSNVPMPLATTAITLDIDRAIPDRELGILEGNGYRYQVSIRSNRLTLKGSGYLTEATFVSGVFTNRFSSIDEQVLDGFGYTYHYDKRNRAIAKHIPGNGWTHMVYDRLDRLILTQDENQRQENKWLFTKYDRLDRALMTGEFTDSRNRKEIQNYLDAALDPILHETRSVSPTYIAADNLEVFYTINQAFPVGGKIYTVTYYDDYIPFTDNPLPDTFNSVGSLVTIEQRAIGLTTGNMVRVLDLDDTPSNDKWINSVTGYDHKSNAVWSRNKNTFLNTEDTVESLYNFSGELERSVTTHIHAGESLTLYNKFSYDHMGRALSHEQAQDVTSGWQLLNSQFISNNIYDELGSLSQKNVGNIQKLDYKYNIRGWLNGINDSRSLNGKLFGFNIGYDGLYNGNIAWTSWMSSRNGNYNEYRYTYDNLNRLTNAELSTRAAGSNNMTAPVYKEGPISYDKNGNINSLVRYGLSDNSTYGMIDNLSYIYKPKSNVLLKVSDYSPNPGGFKDLPNSAENDYQYDHAGNMTKDLNKGIGTVPGQLITYNHLNLPKRVTLDANRYVEYVYDATGRKLLKSVKDGSTITSTQYAGGFVYRNEELEYFAHSEGYARKEANGGFLYVYQYKDHLGNVRLSYADHDHNGSVNVGDIIEETDYYPFGLKHKKAQDIIQSTNFGQKIKYNGKELQDELGLGWYDYQARNYDPVIVRWFNIDPLAETSRRFSPYTYALNNPIRYIDPDGMQVDDWRNSKGVVYNPKANGGKGAYTSNATAEDKKFGEALRNSGPTGAAQFNKLVNSKTEITVDFGGNSNSESLGYVLGYTDFDSTDYTEKADGTINLKQAQISVYTEGIAEFVDDINSGKVKETDNYSKRQKDDIKTIKASKMSSFDVAVSIFGHEIEHAADPANVRILANERRGTPIKQTDSEGIPRRIGNEIIHELAN